MSERAPDHEEALELIGAFSNLYTTIATRHRRSLVQTRYGLKCGDQDVKEAYEHHSEIMDGLLDMLLKHQVDFSPDAEPIETVAEIKERITPLNPTVVKFQLPSEPIPEFHDEYIVLFQDEDYGTRF